MKLIREIIHDVRYRHNLDIYITIVISITISILGVFQIADITIIVSAVLATLTLISLNLLITRKENERINDILARLEQKIGLPSVSNSFIAWSEDLIASDIPAATEICGFYVTNYPFLAANAEALKLFLQRGGKLRFLYVKPNSNAFKLAVSRGAGVDTQVQNHVRSRLDLSLDKLYEIARSASHTDQVQVKFVDTLPINIITLLTNARGETVVYVTVSGFKIENERRPTFVVRHTDGKWFEYFREVFERVWSWEKSEVIMLEQVTIQRQGHR